MVFAVCEQSCYTQDRLIRKYGTMTTQLGDYLRSLREAKGYSTYQLAPRAGCSQSLVTAVENGERLPSLLRLWALTQVLDGDFSRALFFLCVDMGIPPEAVDKLIEGD
jgi:transcriptional regulator with XRE-family HTH domain